MEATSELLVTSMRLPNHPEHGGPDLLFNLGVAQGRWRAVVWLTKQVIDAFASSKPEVRPLPAQSLWEGRRIFEAGVRGSITLSRPRNNGVVVRIFKGDSNSSSQDTFATHDDNPLLRNAMGVIWRSLGSMIVAETDEVTPEVLEIIAYMHHQGVMPESIYNRRPPDDKTAIQQPPTLHLLSSRILTSLSDAAWRAQEKLIVEEAEAKAGRSKHIRPEIRRMTYRMNVAGLRPEIWLELILWSCLHGGWILEGSSTLGHVSRSKPAWKAMSWRELVKDRATTAEEWRMLESAFNASAHSPDERPSPGSIERTVSSEVINAYVDALTGVIDAGPSYTARPPTYFLQQLHQLT